MCLFTLILTCEVFVLIEKGILIGSICLMYYIISGLATTNILRLTAGNYLPVLSSRCVCDVCGMTITPLLQMPIFSFLVCKGKCRKCGTQIPVFPLFLEVTIFIGMSLISALFGFTPIGIGFSFLFYELIRILTILHLGKREFGFRKQYIIALIAMLPCFLLVLFPSILLIYG